MNKCIEWERPELETDVPEINRAFHLALDDLESNIAPFQDGLLEKPAPVILAGKGYDTPWTRDAAINVWNAAGLLMPDAARNTLLSVLSGSDGYIRVGGQYWDTVIWAIGAWHYWLCTGDRSFRDLSEETVINSLRYFEETEYDPEHGLFRGPACYGDGVSAYPDRYAAGDSCILFFREAFPERCTNRGYGIPMFTLSTNCLYAEAYRIAWKMTGDPAWLAKAEQLSLTINSVFWNESRGLYDYLVDDEGRCGSQEALGISFALLFGIADREKAGRIAENITVTPQGIPCLYPSFRRYSALGYGRHSGTVWPHAQGFWASAIADTSPAAFENELLSLTRNALRSGQFAEIYHPETGLPYGGVQEDHGKMNPGWVSQPRQTWSATGYLRMILNCLAGLHIQEDGILVKPVKTESVHSLTLRGLKWRGREIDLSIRNFASSAFLPAEKEGPFSIILD